MSSKRKKEIGIKTLTETERANSPSASQNYRAMDVLAVVFDAYGTFFDLESFAQQVNKIHRGKGYEILRIVRQKQVEYAMTRTIVKKYENFESITRKAIEFALKELGLATTSADRIFSAFLHLKPYNDVVRSLNDLEEVDVRVAMLSNGTQEMVDKLIEYSGLALLAEESVSVEGAKTFKPDPRAYEHVLNHLEIFEREKVFYVSGNTWDVAGAKSFGFNVGWVNRTKQPIFDEAMYDLRPHYEFSNLSEIVTLLK